MIQNLGGGWVRFVFEEMGEADVFLVGDFNGWDRTAEPMNWDPLKKCFNVELFLAPGKYEYKLLLNKEKLTIDPDNPESVYDGFDGCNSVLRVSA